jgi:tryptophan synthase subunit alpha
VERYAPEIVAASSGDNGGGGNEERRHYALGALRSDLVTFTATMKEATRPH